MSEKYFYRPLAYYGGMVLKCAGICDDSNIGKANELYIERKDPVYLPGFVILNSYMGDRVSVDGNNNYKSYAVVEVEVRSVYGNNTIYPANYAAERFASIAGKKTLDANDLANIKALGFTVEEVTAKKLAA